MQSQLISRIAIAVVLATTILSFGCAPSSSAIETAVMQTQASWTKTPPPSPTKLPSATPETLWLHCILGKTMTPNYYDQLLLQRTCVYGVVTNRVVLDSGATLFDIFPAGEPITFFVVVSPQEALEAIVPGAPGLLTTADVGDCIIAIGYPSRLEDDFPQFSAFDVRDIPQLTSELGASNATVQEVSSFCK